MFKAGLYIVVVVAFLWGVTTLHAWDHWFTLLKVLYAVPFWAYFVLIVGDIASAWRSRDSAYRQRFYVDLKDDLLGALLTGFVICAVYVFSKAHFSAGSFDVAAAAIPFWFLTLTTARSVARARVDHQTMKRRYAFTIFGIVSVCCVYSFFIVLRLASDEYSMLASLWLQLTILFLALFGFIETRRMLFILTTLRFELSPFFLAVFGKNGPYGQLQEVADHWNARFAPDQTAPEQISPQDSDGSAGT